MTDWGNNANLGAGGQFAHNMASPVDAGSPDGRHLTAEYNADDHAALTGTNTDANGKALVANGKTELNGNVVITNPNTLEVNGVSTFNDELRAAVNLLIKSLNGMNVLNTTALGAKIAINVNEEAGDVLIGKPDSVAFDNAHVVIQCQMLVGDGTSAGKLDANGTGLAIGGDSNKTNAVDISRTGQCTTVKGGLIAEGDIRVGLTAGSDGKLDAKGGYILKVGSQSAETTDVEIGNNSNSNSIKTKGPLSAEHNVIVNAHDLVLNANADLGVSGYGLVYDSNGPLGGGPSIDFIIAGAIKVYIDANGWHNK